MLLPTEDVTSRVGPTKGSVMGHAFLMTAVYGRVHDTSARRDKVLWWHPWTTQHA